MQLRRKVLRVEWLASPTGTVFLHVAIILANALVAVLVYLSNQPKE
jgi:hypothetical protein